VLSARKVDPLEEYRRPDVMLYTALAQGLSLAEAVAAGGHRLADLVSTDLQLANATQARSSLEQGGYRYYRRVLSGSENCALCSIASTQRYHVRDLMPIHPGCDCGVEAVEARVDPGQVIDPTVLEEIHDAVGDFTGFVDRGS